MKKIIQLLTAPVLILLLIGCKKEKTSPQDSSLSFDYNGMHYVLNYQTQGAQNWGASNLGIYIDRPDLFNGRIDFLRAGCAYLEPVGQSIYSTGNCELHYSDGSPIDSTKEYIYKSGLLNMSYSNCHTKSGYDIITGTNYTTEICDLSGTFDLVLATKNNQLMSITGGILKVYNITR